jgi:hypothetical protein
VTADGVAFDRRLVVPDHVATRELDGELVLLNFDSETYFGLDEVGNRILEVLRASTTVDAGIPALLDECDVDEPQLREDVAALLAALLDGGLVALEPA